MAVYANLGALVVCNRDISIYNHPCILFDPESDPTSISPIEIGLGFSTKTMMELPYIGETRLFLVGSDLNAATTEIVRNITEGEDLALSPVLVAEYDLTDVFYDFECTAQALDDPNKVRPLLNGKL